VRRWRGAAVSGQVKQRFFFEKKKQKTFNQFGSRLAIGMSPRPINQIFLLLFVHKRKCILALSGAFLI
jgi:hypothetical protein